MVVAVVFALASLVGTVDEAVLIRFGTRRVSFGVFRFKLFSATFGFGAVGSLATFFTFFSFCNGSSTIYMHVNTLTLI